MDNLEARLELALFAGEAVRRESELLREMSGLSVLEMRQKVEEFRLVRQQSRKFLASRGTSADSQHLDPVELPKVQSQG